MGVDWQIAFTLGIVLFSLGLLLFEVAPPDLTLTGALFSLAAAGILTPAETFAALANPAVAAIAALFMVSAALRETGALDMTLGRIMNRAKTATTGTLWLAIPVASLSAFLNNAPIVAMMTPVVIDWARRLGLSPSRFLIPLSYSSILGSSTTIIGTSVNLTLAGLIVGAGMTPMTFFELLPVGFPIVVAGLLYLVLVAPRLLPDHADLAEELGERRREYTAAMRVQEDCPLLDQTVEDAGLRQLPGLFLVEIDRRGRVITPVSPDEPIRSGDTLVFAGVVSTIVDLQRIRGLVPIEDEDTPASASNRQRMIEAVISASSPLIGRSIRDSNFRTVYDAAVIAVHRNGVRVPGKIGEIVLRSGDTLLLQCAAGFIRAHRNSSDFFLVSEIGHGGKPRYERAWLALAVLVAMVLAVTLGLYPIAIAAFLATGVLILTRCLTGQQARQSVQGSVLVVIAAGLGIATAMEKTGAADLVAHQVIALSGGMSPMTALAMIYFVCLVMAETLHHNAAVAIMFPIAVATANEVGADPRGFVIATAVASCCAFASPVTYQAHLIVYGPGRYRFRDFIRAGLPLDLIAAAVALLMIPIIWPL